MYDRHWRHSEFFKKTVWCQLEGEHGCSLSPWDGHKLVGVEGSPVSVCGVTTLHIAGTTFVSDFVVVDALGVDCIIGLDFLRKFKGVIDLPKNILQFRNMHDSTIGKGAREGLRSH